MLMWLFSDGAAYFQPLNLFRYLSFRTGGAMLTALIISFVIGPWIIRSLKALQHASNTIREDVPDTHLKKIGTPSMGGLMIVLASVSACLLWANLHSPYIWTILFVILGFGVLGAWDDYRKLTRGRGISGRTKITCQIMLAGLAAWAIQSILPPPINTGMAVPFFKDVLMPLGLLHIPFLILVIAGSSNAVNLTDGLDGLAIGPVIIAAGCFGLIAYLAGHRVYADYLQIFAIPGAGELAIVCGAIIGAGLGFLWFNAPPAMVFMGDTGSLALGGAIGAIAAMVRHELVLLIIGGLFVLETVSVIVQVISFRLTGKRIFAMAPLHHHFEKKGWSEATIVFRFWIIAIILGMVGLSTLKLR